MVSNIVERYIELLVKRKKIGKDQVEEYRYQALCIVESAIVISAMSLVGIIFGHFVNVCVFMLCFINIRNRAGGFHLNAFWKCFLGTLFLECAVIVLAMCLTDQIIVFDCAALVSFAAILIIGAVNHPNMNYSKEEFVMTKKQSRNTVSFIVLMIIFLKIIHASVQTIMYLECAVILAAILLIVECLSEHFTE